MYDDLSPFDLAVLIKLELRTSIVLALIILDITAICGKDNAVIGRIRLNILPPFQPDVGKRPR
jgi:hypothetical protein